MAQPSCRRSRNGACSTNFVRRQNPRAWYNSAASQQIPLAVRKDEMKAHVWVMLKSSVFDPQGQTIQKALSSLGYASVKDVRQGKFFRIELNGLSREEASKQVERLAKDVLTNPVIEEFRF